MDVSETPKVLSIFYGYPAELVAQWCGVSIQTARLYKSGQRKPSRQALRLFVLYRDGRVLNDHWRRWKVHNGQIIDPEGNVTTEAQLRGYYMIMQYAAHLASRDPETRNHLDQLLQLA